MPDHFKIKNMMEENKKSCLSGQVAYFAVSPAFFQTRVPLSFTGNMRATNYYLFVWLMWFVVKYS